MRSSLNSIHTFLNMTALPAREMLRAPITLLLTATTTFVTLLIPTVLAFQFGDTGQRLVCDGGLGLQWTVGILLAAAAAGNLIRRERESGVAAMLLTKPVGRYGYFLSRFAGVSLVVALFAATTTLATLLAHRAAEAHDPQFGLRTDYLAALAGILAIPLACATAGWRNWRTNASFHATAMITLPIYLFGASILLGFFSRAATLIWPYRLQLDLRIILVSAAILVALLIFVALSLALSIYLPPVSTAVLALATLFGGLATPALLISQTGLRPLFYLVPNWNWFWLANELDAGTKGNLPGELIFVAFYGGLILVATLLWGMIMIKKSEVPA